MSLRRDTPATREFLDRGRRSSAISLQESRKRSLRKIRAQRFLRPPSPLTGFETCALHRFDPGFECEGLVVRAHLIKEQTLVALGLSIAEAWHEDFWIPACNGVGTPHGGHHYRLDQGLIALDRRDLPARLERRASQDPRIAAHLDRLYGELPKLGEAA